MSGKISVGMKVPNFEFCTPWKSGLDFHKETAGCYTCLLFLRYYGCSTCQLEIQELIACYPQIAAQGAKLYVVLQSDPATLQEQGGENDFPFDIICDPQQDLYKMLAIPSNPNLNQMSEKQLNRLQQARQAGIVHGKFEGNEAQSPASFIIRPDGLICYAWYGVESADTPTGKELVSLLSKVQNGNGVSNC